MGKGQTRAGRKPKGITRSRGGSRDDIPCGVEGRRPSRVWAEPRRNITSFRVEDVEAVCPASPVCISDSLMLCAGTPQSPGGDSSPVKGSLCACHADVPERGGRAAPLAGSARAELMHICLLGELLATSETWQGRYAVLGLCPNPAGGSAPPAPAQGASPLDPFFRCTSLDKPHSPLYTYLILHE